MAVRISIFRALLALVMLAIAGAVVAAEPAPAQTDALRPELRITEPGAGEPGPLSPAQERAISQGYLVPDQEAYEQAKVGAAEKAEGDSGESASSPGIQAPREIRSFQSIRDSRVGPSDSTGAIGTNRYIELVNLKYAIYTRTNNTPIARGSLNTLAGEPETNFVFDPQMMWDPGTERFYYVMDDVVSEVDNRLAFGFSKTASPSSAADFCKYVIRFGERFPDYPKLGDTTDSILIGANSFGPIQFLGSDLVSVTKPPAGTGCPARSELVVDEKFNLKGADGERAFTPVPANQTDDRQSGHVVAEAIEVATGGSAEFLSIFEANTSDNGNLRVSRARKLDVPRYRIPAPAPQRGSREDLDTLDARNTQAVSAVDSTRGQNGRVALWTQHTIFGGSGAIVRWYEINPSERPSLFQSGTISASSGKYVFNGAISPDRKVDGPVRRYGYSMALGYNTSSERTFADIKVVSKIGGRPLSKPELIKASSFGLDDFTCDPGNVCRWGDYSAATPDPAAPTGGVHGRVWFSNQWVIGPGGNNKTGWGTWNWAITL